MLEVVAETYNNSTPLGRVKTRLPVDGGTVGRGEDNAVVLDDPMHAVSRRHLQFARAANGEYQVTNISAGNHALVNDHNLKPGACCAVRDQDRIQIGNYMLKIREVHNGSADAQLEERSPSPAQQRSAPPPVHGIDITLDDPAVAEAPDESRSPIGRASGAIGDDYLGVLLDGMSHPGASTSLFAGLSDADPDQVLDTTCSGPRCDDPMLALDTHGIELTTLSGKCDELVSGSPAEDRSADSLLADPLTERYRKRPSDNLVDPLKMFGDAEESVFSGLGLLGDDVPSGIDASHHINHRVELSTPFAVPVVARDESVPAAEPIERAPQTLIPDDDFEFFAGGRAEVELPAVDTVPSASIVQMDSHRIEHAAPDPVASGSHAPAPEPEPQQRRGYTEADFQTQLRPVPAPAAALARRTAATPSPAPGDASAEADLFGALLEGLGLPSLPDRDSLDPEFMRLLGRLLRSSTQGTIDLISARATVKREVRANVTVIAPERNNPLKFSPDGEVGLMYLLGRPYPGFMEPVEAMGEAYADLYSHQMGVVSGMRSALGHVLERFDPETITTSAQRNGLIEGLLAVGRKARLWDAYGRYFQNTREQAEDRFQDFFGAVFLDAYDEVASPRGSRSVRRKTGGD